jgi:hypothetical protein
MSCAVNNFAVNKKKHVNKKPNVVSVEQQEKQQP